MKYLLYIVIGLLFLVVFLVLAVVTVCAMPFILIYKLFELVLQFIYDLTRKPEKKPKVEPSVIDYLNVMRAKYEKDNNSVNNTLSDYENKQ